MKKSNFFKRALVAITFALAVSVLALGANPVEANAATKKVTGHANYKKAPKVKVNKTYKVTSKNKNGTFVKFTAPKAGKYQIQIYNMNSLGATAAETDLNLANFYIRKAPTSAYSTFLPILKVKTEGGKTDCLRMATPDSYNNHYKDEKVTTATYLQKRTATLSLKKGETIYVNMSYFTGTKNRCTYNLKIKRK